MPKDLEKALQENGLLTNKLDKVRASYDKNINFLQKECRKIKDARTELHRNYERFDISLRRRRNTLYALSNSLPSMADPSVEWKKQLALAHEKTLMQNALTRAKSFGTVASHSQEEARNSNWHCESPSLLPKIRDRSRPDRLYRSQTLVRTDFTTKEVGPANVELSCNDDDNDDDDDDDDDDDVFYGSDENREERRDKAVPVSSLEKEEIWRRRLTMPNMKLKNSFSTAPAVKESHISGLPSIADDFRGSLEQGKDKKVNSTLDHEVQKVYRKRHSVLGTSFSIPLLGKPMRKPGIFGQKPNDKRRKSYQI